MTNKRRTFFINRNIISFSALIWLDDLLGTYRYCLWQLWPLMQTDGFTVYGHGILIGERSQRSLLASPYEVRTQRANAHM